MLNEDYKDMLQSLPNALPQKRNNHESVTMSRNSLPRSGFHSASIFEPEVHREANAHFNRRAPSHSGFEPRRPHRLQCGRIENVVPAAFHNGRLQDLAAS